MAAAHYRKTFDRLSCDIPLNISAAWAERPGYRHVCSAHGHNYIGTIKDLLIYYNRSVSKSRFYKSIGSRRGAAHSRSHSPAVTPHYECQRLKSIDRRDWERSTNTTVIYYVPAVIPP